jgi:hypothetical protein
MTLPSYNSTKDKNSRYAIGGDTEISGQFMKWWERKKLPKDSSDKIYVLEKMYEGRPELLAHAVYSNTRLWWIIYQYNNILDPATEFVAGRVLRIPGLDRILAFMENNAAIGGIKK